MKPEELLALETQECYPEICELAAIVRKTCQDQVMAALHPLYDLPEKSNRDEDSE